MRDPTVLEAYLGARASIRYIDYVKRAAQSLHPEVELIRLNYQKPDSGWRALLTLSSHHCPADDLRLRRWFGRTGSGSNGIAHGIAQHAGCRAIREPDMDFDQCHVVHRFGILERIVADQRFAEHRRAPG